MNNQAGTKIHTRVGLTREIVVKATGRLRKLVNGNWVDLGENSVSADFLKLSAQGCASGSFNEINTAKITDSGAAHYDLTPTKTSGGTGAEAYVTYELEWTNTTGLTKTINSADIGYDIGGGGEKVYFSKTGLTDAVANNEKIVYQWTMSFTLSSGGLMDKYFYNWAKMVYDGTFTVPNHLRFIDDEAGGYDVDASLLAGTGDGTVAYHTWYATWTNSEGETKSIVEIDVINDTLPTIYSEDAITPKDIANTESLYAAVRITHAS